MRPGLGSLTVSLCQARLAGHNKWSNIRHIKAARDNLMAKKFQLYSHKIGLGMLYISSHLSVWFSNISLSIPVQLPLNSFTYQFGFSNTSLFLYLSNSHFPFYFNMANILR